MAWLSQQDFVGQRLGIGYFEIGGDAFEPAGAVEDAGAEPHGMAARPKDGDVAFVPVAVDEGPCRR
ncbi:hypothetical protein X756_28680 [Mesorhizobium sp. LSHC412B00]|nr:hypothetical protein X756_28680 [Mesorhizobium sp. LSHC412B00]